MLPIADSSGKTTPQSRNIDNEVDEDLVGFGVITVVGNTLVLRVFNKVDDGVTTVNAFVDANKATNNNTKRTKEFMIIYVLRTGCFNNYCSLLKEKCPTNQKIFSLVSF